MSAYSQPRIADGPLSPPDVAFPASSPKQFRHPSYNSPLDQRYTHSTSPEFYHKDLPAPFAGENKQDRNVCQIDTRPAAIFAHTSGVDNLDSHIPQEYSPRLDFNPIQHSYPNTSDNVSPSWNSADRQYIGVRDFGGSCVYPPPVQQPQLHQPVMQSNRYIDRSYISQMQYETHPRPLLPPFQSQPPSTGDYTSYYEGNRNPVVSPPPQYRPSFPHNSPQRSLMLPIPRRWSEASGSYNHPNPPTYPTSHSTPQSHNFATRPPIYQQFTPQPSYYQQSQQHNTYLVQTERHCNYPPTTADHMSQRHPPHMERHYTDSALYYPPPALKQDNPAYRSNAPQPPFPSKEYRQNFGYNTVHYNDYNDHHQYISPDSESADSLSPKKIDRKFEDVLLDEPLDDETFSCSEDSDFDPESDSAPRKKPPNPYLLYNREFRPKVQLENLNLSVGEVSRIVSANWKALDNETRLKYEQEAKRLKEEWNKGLKKISNLKAIEERQNRSVIKKKRKRVVPKDPNQPKHPMSAFLFYLSQVRPSYTAKYPGWTVGPISKMISQAWRSLSAEERGKYEKKAREDKVRYAKEMEKFLSKRD